MDKQIQKDWVAALRSGEYEQGRSRLCTIRLDGSETYCCLGVLADLATKAGVVPEPSISIGQFYSKKVWGDDYLYLPEQVAKWAGLAEAPNLTKEIEYCYDDEADGGSYHTSALSELNDEAKFDFAHIADLIEDQPDDWDGLK